MTLEDWSYSTEVLTADRTLMYVLIKKTHPKLSI